MNPTYLLSTKNIYFNDNIYLTRIKYYLSFNGFFFLDNNTNILSNTA